METCCGFTALGAKTYYTWNCRQFGDKKKIKCEINGIIKVLNFLAEQNWAYGISVYLM